jgi:hypothetical protein
MIPGWRLPEELDRLCCGADTEQASFEGGHADVGMWPLFNSPFFTAEVLLS